jgi:hypothetical protein
VTKSAAGPSRLALSSLAAVALLFSCLLTACGSGSGSGSAAVPKAFYGVVQSGSLPDAAFSSMHDAGVGSTRFQVSWPSVQFEPNGQFNWGPIDATVSGAARQHIDLLPLLYGTPSFEAGGCSSQSCEKRLPVHTAAQRAGWTAFVRAAAERYGPHGEFWKFFRGKVPYDPITHWEIWNEQNNPNQGNPASSYAKLLALTHSAIRSVDPSAELVVGGMFGTPKGSTQTGVTAWSYVDQLYADGAAPNFDAVALHPYSPSIRGIRYQIKKVREAMDAHRDASAPILVTELGWGSSKASHAGTGSRGAAFNVGLAQQAAKLTQSFRLLTNNRESWNIAGVYWYTWQDPLNPPNGLCAFCYSSGLYEADGTTPKPALHAFERFTSQTAGN